MNRARGIEGVRAAVLLREGENGEIRCSLRSKGVVDVRSVAARHAGGGHRNAAGCRVAGTLASAKATLVPEVAAAVRAAPRRKPAGARVTASPRPEGPSGLLLVDKPAKLTSHDVVDVARRLLGTRRIGHTGTLDPAATGLLVLCVGRAGRLQSFLTGWEKTYEGTMRFGIETDTYDTEGTPVGEPHPDPRPERARLEEVCRAFTGEIRQSPPPFSAKKIEGRKFYELARKGEAVPDLAEDASRVREFTILALDGDVARFRVSLHVGHVHPLARPRRRKGARSRRPPRVAPPDRRSGPSASRTRARCRSSRPSRPRSGCRSRSGSRSRRSRSPSRRSRSLPPRPRR